MGCHLRIGCWQKLSWKWDPFMAMLILPNCGTVEQTRSYCLSKVVLLKATLDTLDFLFITSTTQICIENFKQHFIYAKYVLAIFHLTVCRHYVTHCQKTLLFSMKYTCMFIIANKASLLLLCGRIQWDCTHE